VCGPLADPTLDPHRLRAFAFLLDVVPAEVEVAVERRGSAEERVWNTGMMR
jgi:hypothetical protein